MPTHDDKGSCKQRLRRSTFERMERLLQLIEQVPNTQLRFDMQASCLDVISTVETLCAKNRTGASNSR